MSSFLHQLRLPPQEIPLIFIQPAMDSRYVAQGRIQQKTPFPNNPFNVIEMCLPRRCIEVAVLLFFPSFSFLQEPVVIA
jgi:hypothetical protein